MFISAIERVVQFTRPIHTLMRTYGGKQVLPGAATLFFVNENGYAITCKHVVELLAASDNINLHYNNFRKERQTLAQDGKFKSQLKGLELKYKLKPETTIQVKNNFVNSVDKMSGFSCHVHPTLDLAILKFNDFGKIHYADCARFLKDGTRIKQGKFLCRLGFPFRSLRILLLMPRQMILNGPIPAFPVLRGFQLRAWLQDSSLINRDYMA